MSDRSRDIDSEQTDDDRHAVAQAWWYASEDIRSALEDADYLTSGEQERLTCGTCGKRLRDRDHIEGVGGHAFVRTFARAALDGDKPSVDRMTEDKP